jgi:uncharacterized protein YndB with AHSA1/START domain
MGRDFRTSQEITTTATPEEVWDAIATGPGVNSWFMGRNEMESGEGGKTRMELMGETGESTITAWDPPRHFAIRGDEAPDGSFHAFEYLIEARGQGSTVVRLVHNGFIGHDNWEWEYNALSKGDPMYLGTLLTYLEHYRGKQATPLSAWAPPQPDEDTAWTGLLRGLGIEGEAEVGAPVRFQLPGEDEVTGVVDSFLPPGFLLVRADSGLYKFIGGGGMIGVGHHVFAPVPDTKAAESAWQSWLTNLYA